MKKVIYQGLFFSNEECYKLFQYLYENNLPILERKVDFPHVTFNFKPSNDELFPSSIMGKQYEIEVIGYGTADFSKEGEKPGIRSVQGFEVKLPLELMPYYKGQERAHITYSLGEYGKPIDCGKIDFEPIEPFTIKAFLGFFPIHK